MQQLKAMNKQLDNTLNKAKFKPTQKTEDKSLSKGILLI